MKDQNLVNTESVPEIKRTSFINTEIGHLKQSTCNGKCLIVIFSG